MRITPQRCRAIFGNPPPPAQVWEDQFDGYTFELGQMCRKPWDEISREDFCYYLLDLAYVRLQPDLFAWLFPACLWFWYQTLMANDSAECGEGEFHYALYQGRILEKMVTEAQREAIYDLFCDGMLDRLEQEQGLGNNPTSRRVHGFVSRLNSLGYVTPLIGRIWDEWWRLDHRGKALAALKYASGLVYTEGENPLFGRRTPEEGGGGPYLSESDAAIYDIGWRVENLAYLKGILTIGYIQEKTAIAASHLKDEPEAEIARKIATDAIKNADAIEIRIEDLLVALSTPELSR